MPPREWLFRIQDMLVSLEKIREFTRRMDFEAFRASPLAMDAVFYNLTIVGEAARFVPDEVALRHPEIDWFQMRGMRNILVHEYFGADLTIVWKTVTEDVPTVIPKLERILQQEH